METTDGLTKESQVGRCSFCDKPEDQVIVLINAITGPNVSICNECVDMCNDMVMETIQSRRQPRPSSNPT
jgi:ATP-dependent protease Clp ATPase subunit